MRKRTIGSPVHNALLAVAVAVLASVGESAPPAPAACPAVEGLRDVLVPGATIVLGEIHGTEEVPRFVGDVACHAWARGPVTVGLEIPRDEQGRLDAFLGSAGARKDVEALLAGPFWHRTEQDGRSSQAVFALLDRLRTARRARVDVSVVAYDIASGTSTEGRDGAMAAALVAAVRAAPGRTFVILTGNYHSRRTVGAPWDAAAVWMVKHVADAGVTVSTFDVEGAGGSAWTCMAGGPGEPGMVCKARDLRAPPSPGGRAWRIARAPGVAGHDGRYAVGATHASPPAVAVR
jgi:hypothetical protein